MLRYVGKRLLMLLPILVGVTFLVYAIMALTPGDPALRKLGTDATPEALEQLREEMGLNKSLVERYVSWLWNIVTKFDFGESWRTGNSVFSDVLPRIPISMKVTIVAVILSALMGIPMGVFSAIKQNSLADNAIRVLSTVMVALPTFWFAMLLLLLFALYLGWLPAGGADSWKHFVLPIATVALRGSSTISRMTRTTMLEAIREDYVRTARAKGVPQRVVTYKHSLKNALLPVITSIGASFGTTLGGCIIGESVFNMPGLGSLIVLSIRTKDIPTMLACVIILAVWFALIMLAVDLVYAFIDPRIKAKYAKR